MAARNLWVVGSGAGRRISSPAALDCLLADAVLDAPGELGRDRQLGHLLRGGLTGLRAAVVATSGADRR